MNKGLPFALGLCCVWPLMVHAGILYLQRGLARRDWSNIQWSEIRWPWIKHD